MRPGAIQPDHSVSARIALFKDYVLSAPTRPGIGGTSRNSEAHPSMLARFGVVLLLDLDNLELGPVSFVPPRHLSVHRMHDIVDVPRSAISV